jgi:hypothetical protein
MGVPLSDLPGEEWRSVVGYEGRYEVSSMGRVRFSKVVYVAHDQRGRKLVHLRVAGKPKTMMVHKLVALAFYGPRPDGMVTRHLDNNIWNNKVSNLAYDTQKANIADEIARGTFRGRGYVPPPVPVDVDEGIEEWKVALPGIEASSEGRVRIVHMIGTGKNDDGYFMVGLSGKEKIRYRCVHALVAEAFIGQRPEGLVIRHLDGNKENNTVSNLVYGTVAENSADEVRLGRTHYSRKHGGGRYILSADDVRSIRRRSADGELNSVMALEYEVSLSTISHVVTGRTWKYADTGAPTSINGRQRGESNKNHKLSDIEVREIVRLRRSGVSQRDLACRFSVSRPVIHGIVCGQSWRHITEAA